MDSPASSQSSAHLPTASIGAGERHSPFSFIASANCILFEKAKPVFVDIKPDTLNINPELVEGSITQRTKAILVPDMFAHPADWDKLQEIAKKHNLFLIEDSAESLGSEYKGKRCGGFGDVAIFAFSPNKQISTGEGGMIVTNDKDFANLCRSIVSHGRKIEDEKWLEHVRLGYNYRLNEMSCAIGLSQVKRIEEIIKKRERVASLYNKKLKEINNVEIPYVSEDVKIHWWMYVIKLTGNLKDKRDIIMKNLSEKGIACRDYYKSIHLQPFYKEQFGYKEGDFPVTEDISNRSLALPFFGELSEEQVDVVAKNLKEVLASI